MLGAVYAGYVIPLAFLILIVKGEARGIVISVAWGMSAVMAIYGITGFIKIPVNSQIVYIIPVMEELLNGLPLFFMAANLSKSLKFALPRYALAIGLGFSILENNL